MTKLYWQHLFIFLSCFIQLVSTSQVLAQTLDTEPLAVTSVCPGSQIDVTGIRTAPAGEFSVQLSNDGATYTDIPSTFLSASGRYEVSYRATIPANTPAGTTYRIRLVSKNPDINGTPSSSILTVKAKPALPTVPANSLSLCQAQSTGPLSATPTDASAVLVWYGTNATGGTGVLTPTQPSTGNAGVVNYYVAQQLNGCESDRAVTPVEVKPPSEAPDVQSLLVCQNTTVPVVQPTGQNLLWYTNSTGGTGSVTAPVVSTSQTSQTTYYISQTTNGCESPRVAFTITVTPTPPAPGVTQKNICQFAPAEPVTAIGEGLHWYNLDGNMFGEAPTISTDKGGSFSLLVTQTVGGCESPKATFVVTVLTTPVPTVAKTTVEICQGTTAQSLTATGTNLKWTDPNGNVTTTAPAPPTLSASTNPNGDVYYVTQTANGCESPKVAITVFVQSLPTLSILGSTTANLGLEVPLTLTFLGVGPYQYKLSNGLTGTAIKDTTILVMPAQTTIYQVAEVRNKCGAGLLTGGSSATVTVLVPTIQTLALTSATVCAGTSLTASFATSEAFNSGNVFKLQLAKVETDTTKMAYVDVPMSQTANGEVVGTIPANATSGLYRVRVIATNPKIPINGTISPTILTIRPLPAATLTGNQTIFEGQPASLSVVFSGDAPWTFSYRDSTSAGLGAVQSLTATINPYPFAVNPKKTTAYFLTSVSNGCGSGSLTDRMVIVSVNPLLGIEDQSLADAVEVYPVPATANLTVRINGLPVTQTALLEIMDLNGHTTNRQETRHATSSFALDQHPAGTYILHIRVGDRRVSRRIVKL
ncbi:T9SS type A sorting domain-containing protein [Spirosoma sp. HMF4905]|uniref:T9SS type A sorting domain-containing protein n=1 Tax=Spirosoma arboris TaxID=2682092 RepID=A0A7K1SM92_9BACT|nr:T9SS type A sorting domain-containing protein [Spirosoma arboris]MVM34922.1 T9SS type A sorting domain-containing protein [Spirosoma arboris]